MTRLAARFRQVVTDLITISPGALELVMSELARDEAQSSRIFVLGLVFALERIPVLPDTVVTFLNTERVTQTLLPTHPRAVGVIYRCGRRSDAPSILVTRILDGASALTVEHQDQTAQLLQSELLAEVDMDGFSQLYSGVHLNEIAPLLHALDRDLSTTYPST